MAPSPGDRAGGGWCRHAVTQEVTSARLVPRFKTLMTNQSEQGGDSSKTVEISDMKYHIFQVGGSRCCTLWGAARVSQPSTAARVLLHQWPFHGGAVASGACLRLLGFSP